MPLRPAMMVVGIRSPGINRPKITALRPRRANHASIRARRRSFRRTYLPYLASSGRPPRCTTAKSADDPRKTARLETPITASVYPIECGGLGSCQHHQGITRNGNRNAGFLDHDRHQERGQFVRVEQAEKQVGQFVKKRQRWVLPSPFVLPTLLHALLCPTHIVKT